MKDHGAEGFHRPFAVLAKALKRRPDPSPAAAAALQPKPCAAGPPPPSRPMTAAEERLLFLDAVADVVPLKCRRRAAPCAHRPTLRTTASTDESVINALNDLVHYGRGFVVEQTAEYLEGRQQWVPAEVTRRLHRGCFAIQAHIDLHGLSAQSADAAVDTFLLESLRNSLRVVLIVHGRGLSSLNRPVLKHLLVRRLTSGKWRKWVLAFTSAPRHDGGAGGTYILLDRRPIPKKQRRLKIHRDG